MGELVPFEVRFQYRDSTELEIPLHGHGLIMRLAQASASPETFGAMRGIVFVAQFTDEGIELSWGESSARKAWTEVLRVEETPAAFYFVAHPSIAIPKHSLGSEGIARVRAIGRDKVHPKPRPWWRSRPFKVLVLWTVLVAVIVGITMLTQRR